MRLAGIELLAGLPETELRALEERCRWRRHRAGDLILDRDSETRDLLFVVQGKAQVVNYAASGREVIYGVIGSGDYFGELAAIDGEPRSASVIAIEDCLLAALPPQSFHELLLRHGSVALAVLRRLARTIRRSDDRIVDLSTLSSIQRVYRELLRLARAVPGQDGRWAVDPLPTQRTLAAQAGTARETVARALSHLAQDEIAQRRRRSLFILDRGRLERLVLSPSVHER
jgi:CRP/FNR family cyclic AMP-dependent transcriptional regulator